jgi:hypothetical protein
MSFIPLAKGAATLAFRLMYGGSDLAHESACFWVRNYMTEEKLTPTQFMSWI